MDLLNFSNVLGSFRSIPGNSSKHLFTISVIYWVLGLELAGLSSVLWINTQNGVFFGNCLVGLRMSHRSYSDFKFFLGQPNFSTSV